MKVLVACEYSGIVSDAFRSLGHNVTSCDLLPSESLSPDQHYTGDVFDLLPGTWDMIIAFPPCTYLCRAQAHLLKSPERYQKDLEAIEFVRRLWLQPADKIAIENPIGFLSTKFLKPSQITSFNNFGDPYSKDICLWLKNLPKLQATNIIQGTKKVSNHVNSRMSQALKSKIKSKFFPGIAKAMAAQWS